MLRAGFVNMFLHSLTYYTVLYSQVSSQLRKHNRSWNVFYFVNEKYLNANEKNPDENESYLDANRWYL